jgi:hypothetical protein
MKKPQKKQNGQRTPAKPAPTPAKATFAKPTQDQIRDRAYKLFLERGGAGGHAIDDWLAAERELSARK